MSAHAAAGSPVATSTRSTPPRSVWTRAMEARVGIIPLPVYVLLLTLIAAFAIRGKISAK